MAKEALNKVAKALKNNRILMIVCVFVVMGLAVALIQFLQEKTLERFTGYALNNNTNAFNNGGAQATGTGGLIIAGAGINVAYHGFIDILEPNIAEKTGLVGMQTGTGHLLLHSGSFNLTTQLTGIKFKVESGNISGSIQIYGYAT